MGIIANKDNIANAGKVNASKINKNKVKRNFSNAANYDSFTSYHNLTLKMISQTIKNYLNKNNAPAPPKHILDIGCGTGQGYFIVNEAIPNYKFNYFGLDFAIGLLDRAKQNFSISGNRDNFLLICADAELPPLKDKKFDIIFSNMALHWLNNTLHFLKNVKSALKDEGIVILSFLSFGTLRELSECLKDALIERREQAGSEPCNFKIEDFKLHKFPCPTYMEKEINKSGLEIIDSKVFEYVETADSSLVLLKRINMLGAKNALNAGQMPLSLLKRILNIYDKSYRNCAGKVYATYKIAYLVLKKTNENKKALNI
ncbi:MAG: methyltransferase domain-containing protein [Deltaproteobacteria bacterium]|jgi:ubiquinone/menaquinone biosynthesis C-methylase UbiE|nr:methyltransferase domain-containing protein [Deltaproteobacteria bacterium]MCL5880910.1 methyltransferase domain-containing protein [Deltaproteobacteria bacterium]MDA8303708.1 methyltransferase domain-containing protein [Deltaproteobacteria bacterium]